LPDEALTPFLGRYSVLDGKTIITIERGEEGLLLNPGSGKSAHLLPESDSTFRIVEGGQIAFTTSEAGNGGRLRDVPQWRSPGREDDRVEGRAWVRVASTDWFEIYPLTAEW
jgi:hypothetical protein